MVPLFTKSDASPLLAFLAILLTLISASCKNKQDNQPDPQVASVLIQAKHYPVVAIGDQLWTTLNYSGPGGVGYKTGSEHPEYGRYYTFAEVKTIALPDGWRLPTMQDYLTLAQHQGIIFTNGRATDQDAIKKLASITNWRSIAGTNASGFNAYPAGYCFQNIDPIDGDISEFWMADGNTISIQESATGKGHNIMFYDNSGSVDYRFNLRFIRNR